MKRHKCETRAGQGGQHHLLAPISPACTHASSTLTGAQGYRASSHILSIYIRTAVRRRVTLPRIFNKLPTLIRGSCLSCASVPSTHALQAYYRASTHIFTALRPMFLARSLSHLPLLRLASKRIISGRPSNYQHITVFPPTFLPSFHTPLYRASNHHLPVLPPTEFRATTALSPIKIGGNLLNTFSVQTCKVVSKFDLKNTTSLMMSFFLFFVWSTPV
jgi:hypothetical protein